MCEKTASSLSLVLKHKVRQREKNVRAVDDEVVFINRTCVAKIIATGFMVKSDFLTLGDLVLSQASAKYAQGPGNRFAWRPS